MVQYCMNPDIGIFTKVAALILGSNGEIKWTQQESRDKGVYVGVVKEGESLEFTLSNQPEMDISPEDKLIMVTYVENGMAEDGVLDARKGIFGKYEEVIEKLIIED